MTGTVSTAEPVLPLIARRHRDAVATCIDRYAGLVWSLARRFLSEGDAEGAVQEVFIELWRAADRYDPARGSEATFVATVARHRIFDRLRRGSRRPATEPLPEPDSHLEPASLDNTRLETDADARTASRALARLAPDQQRAIQLAIVWGLSHREVAEVTGTPLGTVKSHIRRGLATVRRHLEGAS